MRTPQAPAFSLLICVSRPDTASPLRSLEYNSICGIDGYREATYTAEGITAIAQMLQVNNTLTSVKYAAPICLPLYCQQPLTPPRRSQFESQRDLRSHQGRQGHLHRRGHHRDRRGAQAEPGAAVHRVSLHLKCSPLLSAAADTPSPPSLAASAKTASETRARRRSPRLARSTRRWRYMASNDGLRLRREAVAL